MNKSESRNGLRLSHDPVPTALMDPPPSSTSSPSPTNSKSRSLTSKLKAEPSLKKARTPTTSAKRHPALHPEDDGGNRQAELFYLQKQIQLQTQMVFILEDGAKIQGIVEWYDRQSVKVRGKSRTLIYKSAIKYLYKAGEVGVAPDR